MDGLYRVAMTASGIPMPEDLVTVDPTLRRLQYRITAPMFAEHLSTLDVHDLGDGTCLAVYSVDADPAALAQVIGGAARSDAPRWSTGSPPRASASPGAHPQSVVCMPSRSTIPTGQHPTTHGVWMNGVPLPVDAPSVAAELHGAGYRTALVGKAHFEPFLDPFFRFAENSLAQTGTEPPGGHSTAGSSTSSWPPTG